MNNQPLVSIITPFLNTEKFIQEAIESVIIQSYENWELLLIDDGSTDRSTAIAQEYVSLYPKKVYYFEHDGHQNCGKSTSRNLGVSKAKGKYIAFLDADDIFLPQKLEHQVAILESQPETGMVYGPTQHWYSWTGKPEDYQRDSMRPLGVEPNTLFHPPSLLTEFLKTGEIVPCTCGVLVRREVMEAVGGFDDSIQYMFEDQVLLAKICLHVPVFVDSSCWDRYRQHSESSCSKAMQKGEYHPSKPNRAHQIYLNWVQQYITTQQVKDAELWKALHKAIFPYRYPFLYFLLRMKNKLKQIGHKRLPGLVHRFVGTQLQGDKYIPPTGAVDFGSLRRVIPMSQNFGYERGQPVDRYYIENFLARCQDDIRGRVLEVGDDGYTRRFGGGVCGKDFVQRITQSDVLHVTKGNPKATIIGDLASGDNIPSDSFDCFILTHTIQLIYDVRATLKTVYRILKPGGVALVTVPGISHIGDHQWSHYWCWSFTALSIQRLFEESFPSENLQIETHGNVLVAAAFLYGLATEELRQEELDYHDPNYQVTITIRAVKPQTP
ncbi:glycosyltransferase [Brasilonema sp. UFV-L1]|uniref:glycosyltransferase n=1 Tax=Brasilonema sp. UFV-L1 TaxID=2234130 RepID=UPI00145E9ED1|nr:glycosyltransferase [Brasilonema sp. UFV-L1]NMG07856.1 glycosyl transferase family 2 [Brasilonema sp. UFV-L1]